MLFDLRGRGRRRTVQVIYLSLAILMGGGLILFGIGGNFSGGGLFDAIGIGGGGNGGGDNQLEDLEKTYEERVQTNPQNAAAWAQLARVRVQLAGDDVDQNTGQFTEGARGDLQGAATAWRRYLALEPPRPNADTAQLMTRVFQALNQPADGVRAAEIAADAQPNANNFFTLAVFAYQAGQTRKADLASRRAVQLTPAAQRKQVRDLLAQIKQNPTGQQQGTGTQPATPLG
jgi:tetratricopeptide (TPR) repeat protein